VNGVLQSRVLPLFVVNSFKVNSRERLVNNIPLVHVKKKKKKTNRENVLMFEDL